MSNKQLSCCCRCSNFQKNAQLQMHLQSLALIQLRPFFHLPVHSWVSADGCYRRPHVLQIPHLDGAIVTPWNHIVTHCEHCRRHRATKDGQTDTHTKRGQLLHRECKKKRVQTDSHCTPQSNLSAVTKVDRTVQPKYLKFSLLSKRKKVSGVNIIYSQSSHPLPQTLELLIHLKDKTDPHMRHRQWYVRNPYEHRH